jgi:hypothetical protein
MATIEVVAKSEHRGAALQEARFVVDEIAADRNYEHRLMNYNNDPTTTFADIQEVLRITESLITLRLKANGNKIISGASIVTQAGQTVTQEALNTDCIALRMVQQKPAPKIKGKPAPDVIVTVPDDLSIRFELRNNCKQDIYYLAETVGEDKRAPTGFLIYRDKDKEWKARTPTWRREGSLTDPYLYYWLPLRVGERVEFEYTDLSRIEGERSLAVYLNESPCNEKRVELLAEPFTINKQRLK